MLRWSWDDVRKNWFGCCYHQCASVAQTKQLKQQLGVLLLVIVVVVNDDRLVIIVDLPAKLSQRLKTMVLKNVRILRAVHQKAHRNRLCHRFASTKEQTWLG